MPVKTKMFIILLLWLTIALTVAFAVENMVVRIILLCVAVGVTAHIALIKKRKVKDIQK